MPHGTPTPPLYLVSYLTLIQLPTTSYLSVPASPKKRARVSPHDSSGYSTPADMAPGERQDDLDLEYLYHRIESLTMDGNVRKRTEGVSVLLYHF